MTIRYRVFLLTILGVAGATGLTALGYRQLEHAAGDGGRALLGSAQAIREQMQADMMHDALRADVLSALVATNAEEMKAVNTDLDEHCKSFTEALDALTAGQLSPDSRSAVTSARPVLDAYIKSAHSIIAQAVTDKAKARAMLPAFGTAFSELETRMETIGDTLAADAATVQKEGDELQRTAMRSLMAIGGISVGVMSLAGFLIARSITRPMKKLVDTMQDMASGSRDLTQRVDDQRRDELGQLGKAFNTFVTDLNNSNAKAREASERVEADAMTLQNKVEQMLAVTDAAGNGDFTVTVPVTGDDAIGRLAEGFRRMLSNISDLIRQTAGGAVQIDAGAQQIAGASQALASGASQQAASLEQISASLEEITSMTNQNADNAQQASSLSAEAQKAADKGKDQTGKLSEAMKQIQESADKVSAIIKTIDDIAFQTNLLALNAAVEAARAGEAGKGFAVVAEEVRNLAQRSAEAAKNTAGLITESKGRADTGVSIAAGVGKALEEIFIGSSKVNTLLNEIASASREQAQGVAQVNKGVTELDKVTQQNAGNSEELASAAQETASQVASLRELVAKFKVEDHAGAPPSTNPVRAASSGPTMRRPRQERTTTGPACKPGVDARMVPAGVSAGSAGHSVACDDDKESFERF